MDFSTAVYITCVVVAGGLLMVTVLVDDILGSMVDLDVGGVSFFPLLFGFISMFGIGGLIGQFNFGMTGREAALLGVGFGVAGVGVVYFTFRGLKLSEAPEPPTLQQLVGQRARVSVSIPAGKTGTIFVNYAGAPQAQPATAESDIPAGTAVTIVDVAGPTLVVQRFSPNQSTEGQTP